MTNYELDQAFFETNDLQDFADFLDDRKIHSRWEEVSVKNLSVNEKAAFMPNMGVSEPAAGEAAYYLKSPELSDTYLRSIAVSSLLERARIGGSALGNLTRTDFSMFVTACLATAKEDDTTKIRIQDGKISAFMAGTYRIIDQTSIFDETVQKISSEFSGEFIKGAWNHCVTLADYTVTMPTSDYADIFRSKGLTFSDIVMATSINPAF